MKQKAAESWWRVPGKQMPLAASPHFMLGTGRRQLQADMQRQESKKGLEVRLDPVPPIDTDAHVRSRCERIWCGFLAYGLALFDKIAWNRKAKYFSLWKCFPGMAADGPLLSLQEVRRFPNIPQAEERIPISLQMPYLKSKPRMPAFCLIILSPKSHKSKALAILAIY